MADETDEQRISPRAPIELRVEYRKVNTFFADYTKNISKGGTFIKTARPLEVGTRFVFKLIVPARSEPFELVGDVVWARADGDDPGMGIRFVYASAVQRADFESLVEAMMRESLGPVIARRLLERR